MQPSQNERRAVVMTAGLAMFLSTLDSGIVTLALPSLGRVFGADADVIAWVATGYVAAISTTILLFGRLADRLDPVRVVRAGFLVFGVASVACGCAWSTGAIITARVLHGVGAAMLQATAAALVTTRLPAEERGPALGWVGLFIGLGPVLGPSLGGLILAHASWRWLFFGNVPLCAFALWVTVPVVARPRTDARTPLGVGGIALFGVAGVLSLLALAGRGGAGLSTLITAGAVFAWGVFIARERRTRTPFFLPEELRSVRFTVPLLGAIVFGLGTTEIMMAPPFLLEAFAHLPVQWVGLVCLAGPLGIVLLARVAGKLTRTISPARLMVVGAVVMCVALLLLATLSWSRPATAALLLFMYGVGGGIFQAPGMTLLQRAVSADRQALAGSLQRMVQNFGIAVAAVLVGGNPSNRHVFVYGGVANLMLVVMMLVSWKGLHAGEQSTEATAPSGPSPHRKGLAEGLHGRLSVHQEQND